MYKANKGVVVVVVVVVEAPGRLVTEMTRTIDTPSLADKDNSGLT